MSQSLDITGRVQTAFVGWLTDVPLSWAPRLITGYRRAAAGEALQAMESAGEPDTVIVECTSCVPTEVNSPVFKASVSLRVRHDPDRVEEAYHYARVSELAARVQDYAQIRDELNAQPDFDATQISITGQSQTGTGRSFETTISLTLDCAGATVA